MTRIRPPRHIVWSTDTVDLSDPFQRRWYIRQVLLHGQAEDIRTLDLDEVETLGRMTSWTWRWTNCWHTTAEPSLEMQSISISF